MDYLNHCKRLHRLSELLKKGYCGSCKGLAQEIGTSRSSLFRYMDELKDYGAIVSYSKEEKRYVIDNDFDFLKLFS